MIQENNLRQTLAAQLVTCDLAAVENVRAGRGGPFGASMHVWNIASEEMIDIAGPVGNAVLETGLASAHAEDRLLQPENIDRLKSILQGVGPDMAHVYVISSGESCPACHAKIEILARTLLHEKLLTPRHFTLVYGASYEEAESVAGFDDAKYHHDFQKPPGTGLVKQSFMRLVDLPENVRLRMFGSPDPVAVIATKDSVLAGSGVKPEIDVIHTASARQKRARIDEPWNLRRATLYTYTRDIGPMAYAECQWANIANWVTVEQPDPKLYAIREAPDVTNKQLFGIIATRPYTNADSAMEIMHLTPFDNLAQHEWARIGTKNYNGI